jgi:tRNA dimethylallyltransferase
MTGSTARPGEGGLPPAVLLAGPTASGKTALACALFDRYPLELVSVDSAQVFIDMNVGTAKPDATTLVRYPHHLIDLITPDQAYSAGRFLRDVRRVMGEITARGKVPLLVGGTMLYYKVLLEGIAELPPADPALRQEIEDDAAVRGWPALHAELAKLDPTAAARIDPNHSQRIQRALELVRGSGRSLDQLYAAGTAHPAPAYHTLNLALFPDDRAELHRRIGQRFEAMLADGLVDEVAALRAKYPLNPNLPSMRCVGYRQAWDFLDGTISRAQLVEQGLAATRQLAKRQLTWLRSLPFTRLDPASPELTATACRLFENHLSAGTCRGLTDGDSLRSSHRDSLRSQKIQDNATLPRPHRSTPSSDAS